MVRKFVLLSVIAAAAVLISFPKISADSGKGVFYEKLNIPVSRFLASPTDEAGSVFDFPVNIRITGRTQDKKWYKIRLSYNFFGYYEYEGWVKVE